MLGDVSRIPIPNTSRRPSSHVRARSAVPCFLCGPENQLAATVLNRLLRLAAAGQASPEDADSVPVPIVVTGPTGSGKTHLVRGLAHIWQNRFGPEAACVTPAIEFTRAFAEADGRIAQTKLRDSYRNASLLALDDLDQLPKRAPLQRELLTTIDAIDRAGGFVIIASSKSPGRSPGLSPALRSRLLGGFILPLALPRSEARKELARQFATERGIRLTGPEIDAVAGPVEATPPRIAQRIAELEMLRERGAPTTPQEQTQRIVLLRTITAVTARFFSLRQADLRGNSRRRSVVFARSIAMFLARELSGRSLASIGREYGDRDHTTVLHAVRKIADQLPGDESIRSAVTALRRVLFS